MSEITYTCECGVVVKDTKRYQAHRASPKCIVVRHVKLSGAADLTLVNETTFVESAKVVSRAVSGYSLDIRFPPSVTILIDKLRRREVFAATIIGIEYMPAGWKRYYAGVKLGLFVPHAIGQVINTRYDETGQPRDDNELGKLTEEEFWALI